MERSKQHRPRQTPSKAATYQIQILGTLDAKWSDWFEGLVIAAETDDVGSPITTLTGPIVDQVALRGIMTRLWDLNVTLLSATRIQEE